MKKAPGKMSGAPPVELAIRCAADYRYLFFSILCSFGTR